MRWIRDNTQRFRWRPFYRTDEIDAVCERRIQRFLRYRYGQVGYPVGTDDLTVLIEQEASDLDLYADLAGMRADIEVEGVTTFFRHRRPRVQISRAVSLEPQRLARLRTTLAHELGHVLLHDFARQDRWSGAPAPDDLDSGETAVCLPAVTTPGRVDWMEWQANYASGALLMPRTAVSETASALLAADDTEAASRLGPLLDWMQGYFVVSEAAAFVRLRQLGYLPASRPEPHRRS